MTKDDAAQIARDARAARLKTRRRRRRKVFKEGDALPRVRRTRGLIGVRKMAVTALQQQVEALQDRLLGPADRQFLLDIVKTMVTGEKVAKMPAKAGSPLNSDGDTRGPSMPALEPRGNAQVGDNKGDTT